MSLVAAAARLLVPEAIDAQDRVRVPDGRIGKVIGFYRRQDESVLVQFSSGTSSEFLMADVRHARSELANRYGERIVDVRP
jgi:hypothetical protein